MKRRVIDYLKDIINECDYVLKESQKLTYEDFIKDETLKRAFVRSLEVICEAGIQISSKIRHKYPGLPWREMRGMRNKLIHEFFRVDYKIVWETIEKDIPDLKKNVSYIIKEMQENIHGPKEGM